jgi:hypothetical protein
MVSKNSPTDIRTVVDIAFNRWNVVSSHQWQHEAEAERDRRNDGLARRRYTACIAIGPVAERMGRSCG